MCGKELSYTNKSGMCQVCYNEHYNKTSKPPKETMLNDMQTYKSYSSLSRYYHVSSKTLQKWFKQDNIDFI